MDSFGTVPGLDDEIFLKYIASQRPVVLVLFIDGHKTHMTLDIIDLC